MAEPQKSAPVEGSKEVPSTDMQAAQALQGKVLQDIIGALFCEHMGTLPRREAPEEPLCRKLRRFRELSKGQKPK